MTLNELQQKIQDYIDHGYYQDVAAAARQAQIATRDFIARTHPQTAFGGKQLGGSQIIIGRYDVHADSIVTNVYANYFSRWYNTGAFGRIIRGSGPRAGQRGPTYPSRGSYFESNRAAIEDSFAKSLEEYLEKHISL
jgi:hypothetical protein